MHHTVHYLQLLHFPDNVFQQQLLLRWHERGHLWNTAPCLMTSTICCLLFRNTPGITRLKQQSAVNYHTGHMNPVKSQYGSHETWTCPLPCSGRSTQLSVGWVLFVILILTPLTQQRMKLVHTLTGTHSPNTRTLCWLSDRDGEQFVVNYKPGLEFHL